MSDHHANTMAWLDEHGLEGSLDPNVQVLLSAAAKLDGLAAEELSDFQRQNAEAKLRNTITQARRAMAPLLEASEAEARLERQRRVYDGMAARWLGWFSLDQLNDDLRAAVVAHMEDQGIRMSDWEPTIKED